MYIVSEEVTFSAAHQVTEQDGSLEAIHGHDFRIIARIVAGELDEYGMVFDFRILREKLQEIVSRLHRKRLNDVAPFDRIPPTAENIAKWVYDQLSPIVEDIAGAGAQAQTERLEGENYEEEQVWRVSEREAEEVQRLERVRLYEVEVFECPTCSAVYRPD